MDLGTMLRVMIKRWYVSVPALLMAMALPVVAWIAVPAKYQSTSTISLLNSTAAANAGGKGTGNPFTSFDNSLTGAADYLARTLNSDQSMADMAKLGVTDLAAAELAPNASGPFIILTITGKDPQHILTEMDTFDKYADQKMLQIQTQSLPAPLPANVLLRTIVMVPPQKPITSMKSRLEDVAGAGVGGMVLLFVAVFGTEALAIRRGKPSVMPARGAAGARRRVPAEADEPYEPYEPYDVIEAADAPDSYLPPLDSEFDEHEFSPRPVSRSGSRPASSARGRSGGSAGSGTSGKSGTSGRSGTSGSSGNSGGSATRPTAGAGPRPSASASASASSAGSTSDSDSGADSDSDYASGTGRSRSGSLAKRAPSGGTPTPLETTINLPRYREPDLEPEDEPDAEPWTDLDPARLEDFAVGDRDPGSR